MYNPNILEKIMIKILGRAEVGTRMNRPVYAFKCKKHGYVLSTVSGYREYLTCDYCYKEQYPKESK